MPKERLDILLVARGLAETRNQAQRLIMAGQVCKNGSKLLKPSLQIDDDSNIQVLQRPRYVSRGGEKLEAALNSFPIPIKGRKCADIGASTGGFTDCLLQNGAECVYSIDVGKGILEWKLRNNPKVVVIEETNARYLKKLPEIPEVITIDVSFISLKILLPVIKKWFSPRDTGDIVCLIKPQFEAGRKEVAKGKGVIKDPFIHQRILEEICRFSQEIGLEVKGLLRSPLLGPKGNIEFLAWFKLPSSQNTPEEINRMISLVLDTIQAPPCP